MPLPKICGLIGYPVKHSLSPAMHNAAFGSLGINAEYKLFEIKPDELDGFFHALLMQNLFGLNVTIPYKEKVIPFLKHISAEAKLIGAVNTIKISGNKAEGFNTDGEGFLRHLEESGFNPKGKIISIIGAGGAAKAVSVYLSKAKPMAITIYDTDMPKAAYLIGYLEANFKNIKFKQADFVSGLNVGFVDLLINATPIGMTDRDSCLVGENLMHKDLFVYDLIYNPAETKLLKAAKNAGAKTANGLGMLLYQGAAAFEIWTGKKAPVEVMRKALKEAEEKCSQK